MRQRSASDCSTCHVPPCIWSWLLNKSKLLRSASGLTVPQQCLAVVDDQRSLVRHPVARHRPAMPAVAASFGFTFESRRPCFCCRAAAQSTCTWLRSIPARRSDAGWPGRTCWHLLLSDPGGLGARSRPTQATAARFRLSAVLRSRAYSAVRTRLRFSGSSRLAPVMS